MNRVEDLSKLTSVYDVSLIMSAEATDDDAARVTAAITAIAAAADAAIATDTKRHCDEQQLSGDAADHQMYETLYFS